MAKDMRDIYTDTLLDLAKTNPSICVIEADLMNATGTRAFKEAYPDRFFDVGVAEANMVGIASGLSAEGKIPFAATFGTFASRRVYDQFFLSANYARLNVKLVGTDPGITAVYNGGTHMPFEDIGMMRLIPDLVIIEPCDLVSLEKLVRQAADHYGCVYIRLHRKGSHTLYDADESIELGKAKVLRDGSDVTLIASGFVLVPEALKAAELLEAQGVSTAVIDMHTIKPLDEELVAAYAQKTGAIVTCENHQVFGGLGSAVADSLTGGRPVPMERVGSWNKFGQVGNLEYLQEAYGMTAREISARALKVIERK